LKRAVAVGFVLVLAFGAGAQPIPPSEQPEAASQAPSIQTDQHPENRVDAEQRSATDQKGTSQATPALPQVRATAGEHKGCCEGKHGEEEGTEFWPAFLGYRLKITDTLLVLFTLGLFWATWFLHRSTKRLVTGAEQTAERQLRAYVHVDGVRIANVMDARPALDGSETPLTDARLLSRTEGPLAILTIKNFGQTPAHNVRHFGDMCVREFPLDEHLPDSGEGGILSSGILPPGGHATKYVKIPQNLPLGEGDKGDLQRRTKALYVFGRIDYRDVFGNECWTTYRYFHNSGTGRLGVTTEMSLDAIGNDADSKNH
jgi:hypothetical protein